MVAVSAAKAALGQQALVVALGAGRGFVGDGDMVARLAVVEPAGPGSDVQPDQHGVATEVHEILLSD